MHANSNCRSVDRYRWNVEPKIEDQEYINIREQIHLISFAIYIELSIHKLIPNFTSKFEILSVCFGAMETNKSAIKPTIESVSSTDEVGQATFNKKF